MGPYHEFALYRGIQDDHRDHQSSENLLKPYNVEIRANAARQSWDVDGLHLEVALAGGSREECESWYVTLKRSIDVCFALKRSLRVADPQFRHNPAGQRYLGRTAMARTVARNRENPPVFGHFALNRRGESAIL